ncbi:DUF4142 domain-containing protein [Pelagibacterium sp. H642]|uniref:DUF4142 domain-containing protein n=1 Tax=Pelagibacterium sp. H642 TaxID=1881069 RepID=UPI0028155A30|nr:DUF4142 domain-containing protein [Pelagibacterium sp. H642]WMT92886.1 DUF4142 domain-containing protein [Pelagibacterium sp. H642]
MFHVSSGTRPEEEQDVEIVSSQLALEMSQTPEVQELAQQMIDDHTMAGRK